MLLSRTISMFLIASLSAFTGCATKLPPKPTETPASGVQSDANEKRPVPGISETASSMQESEPVFLSGGPIVAELQRFYISVPPAAIKHGRTVKNLWKLSLDIDGAYQMLTARFPPKKPGLTTYWFASKTTVDSFGRLNILDKDVLTKSKLTLQDYSGYIPGQKADDGHIIIPVDFNKSPFNNVIDENTQLLLTLERKVMESKLPGAGPSRHMFDYDGTLKIWYKWEFSN